MTAELRWFHLGRHWHSNATNSVRELLVRLAAWDVLDVSFGRGEARETATVRLNPALMVPSHALTMLEWNALVGNQTRESELVLRLALLERIAPDGEFTHVSKREILRTCGVSYSGLKRVIAREVESGTLRRRYDSPRDLLLSWGPRVRR